MLAGSRVPALRSATHFFCFQVLFNVCDAFVSLGGSKINAVEIIKGIGEACGWLTEMAEGLSAPPSLLTVCSLQSPSSWWRSAAPWSALSSVSSSPF